MTPLLALEIQSALMALPIGGSAGLLGIGAAAPSFLWAAGTDRIGSFEGSLVDRFHHSLSAGADALGASEQEWMMLRATFPLPVPRPLSDMERERFRSVHARFCDGVVAALLDHPRTDEADFRAGFDRTRRLFVEHGDRVRMLRAEAEAQVDAGLCAAVFGRIDGHRAAREAAYRIGIDYARRGADPRAALVRVRARRALNRVL